MAAVAMETAKMWNFLKCSQCTENLQRDELPCIYVHSLSTCFWNGCHLVAMGGRVTSAIACNGKSSYGTLNGVGVTYCYSTFLFFLIIFLATNFVQVISRNPMDQCWWNSTIVRTPRCRVAGSMEWFKMATVSMETEQMWKNPVFCFGELFGYALSQNHYILIQCRCPLYTGVGWFWWSLELLCCHGNYTKNFKILKMLQTSGNFTVTMSNIGRCGIWRWNFQNICCYHGNNAKRSKLWIFTEHSRTSMLNLV